MDENNIYLLETPLYMAEKMPENYDKVKGEIINLLKSNNFSISYSASLFKHIISELGSTPINEL